VYKCSDGERVEPGVIDLPFRFVVAGKAVAVVGRYWYARDKVYELPAPYKVVDLVLESLMTEKDHKEKVHEDTDSADNPASVVV